VGYNVSLSNVTNLEDGLQKITITVERDGEVVLITNTYKARYNE